MLRFLHVDVHILLQQIIAPTIVFFLVAFMIS